MDFTKLNDEQRRAACFEGKHLLVLAGAGTGKTRTIIARAAFLIEKGVDPTRIKILSFTKKSANEIVSRIKIESSDNPQAKKLSGSTFHSWCMEIIHHYATAFGLEDYTCIDEEDRESAFKLIMGQVYGKKNLKLEDVTLKPESLIEIYSFSINTGRSLTDSIRVKLDMGGDDPAEEGKVEKIRTICERIIRGYIEFKKSRRYIDYDDMLNVVAKSLKGNPQLRYAVSSQYSHILVDEAQDTNPLQWLLLESFFDNCHLFCVGDDAQSIYSFRGADFKSIHSFSQRVPDGEVYQLNQNYRSTQEILDLSNWVLDRSPLHYNKHLVGVRGHGVKPQLHLLSSGSWEEANTVTDIILDGMKEGKKYHDFMVLARGIYAARTTEAACLEKEIPYVVYGGTALMRSAHVRDVIAALRIVANYRDDLAWTRYLLLWEGIGEVAAARIVAAAVGTFSLGDAVEAIRYLLPRGTKPYDTLKALVGHTSPAEAIRTALSHMEGVLKHKYDNWDYRKRDFDALNLVASKCLDIPAFIEEYILDPVAEATLKIQEKSAEDVVVISTIHSAKGLEADTCFILNVTPKTYPSSYAVTEDEVEEERRCLYVALTRAKNHLYVMSQDESTFAYSSEKWAEHRTDKSLSGKIDLIRRETPPERTPGQPVKMVYCINNGGKVDLLVKEDDFLRDYTIVDKACEMEESYFLNGLPDYLVDKVSSRRMQQFPSGGASPNIKPVDGPGMLDDFNFS